MNKIINADVIEGLKQFPDCIADMCVTSPPYYGLRSYLNEDDPDKDKEVGSEETPQEYIRKMVEVFREVRRVLKDNGTLWINIGDSYVSSATGSLSKTSGFGPNHKTQNEASKRISKTGFGLPEKNLIGIPWRLAFALQDDGWILRQDLIWSKRNPMPSSVTDRCVTSHEYVFLLTKNAKYYFDHLAIKEPIAKATLVRAKSKNSSNKRKDCGEAKNQGGLTPEQQDKYYKDIDENTTRNKRSVWSVSTNTYSGAHFATFPPDLIEPMILAGTSEKGHCPKCGSRWVRITERLDSGYDGSKYGERVVNATGGAIGGGTKKSTLGSSRNLTGKYITNGWKPTCECGCDPVPDIVLDCFLGSGTTAGVAVKLGRQYIGVELNSEYCKLHEERIKSIVNYQKKETKSSAINTNEQVSFDDLL